MAEIVNLRQARKRKARVEKERISSENRVLHGRSKAERRQAEALSEKSASFIEGHRREPKDGGSDP